MHAFDLDKLAGQSIRVRRAQKGETIRTLDGVDRKLEPDMLVIADRDRAQAVAGVMGGAASEVSASTRTIVFESAYFKPASVRRTSKRLGLKTEASARFERGADVNAPVVALQRAIALMEHIGAGKASAPVVDRYPSAAAPARLHLRRARLAALLGATVPDADVERILRGLGLDVSRHADGWDVVAPTFRVDLLREVDLIEEVGRHYGFDRLEATFPVARPGRAAARSAHRPRPARAPRADGGRTVGGRHLRVHRAKAAAPVPGGRGRRGRHREPAVRQVRHAAAVAPARTRRRRGAQSPARPPRRGAVRDWHPLHGARRNPRRRARLDGRRRRTTGRTAPARSTSSTSRASSSAWPSRSASLRASSPAAPPFLVAGQPAAMTADGTPVGVLGLLAPAIADGRGAPRQDAIFRRRARPRCRVGRARGAQRCRAAAAAPSVRRPRSLDRRGRRLACGNHSWHHSGGRRAGAGAAGERPLLRSLLRARACRTAGQPVAAADVPGGRSHADRRRGAAERRAILAALVREHGAVQR